MYPFRFVRVMQNAFLLAETGFDAADNEPSNIWQSLAAGVAAASHAVGAVAGVVDPECADVLHAQGLPRDSIPNFAESLLGCVNKKKERD